VVEELPVPVGLSIEAVKAAALQFMGETLQRAPAISAIKQAGKPLYKRVRSGEEVVPPERSVTVHALEIERVDGAEIELRVHAAKGFYVRSLARDLARALGSCGHLTRLRRLASGPFEVAGAVPYAVLQAAAGGDAAARAQVAEKTLPLAAALRGHASLCVTTEGETDIKHGRPLVAERLTASSLPAPGTEPIALTNAAGALLALGRAEADRVLIVRGIHPDK
jgi:tRNA pseudouridine55 synthase